MKCSDLVVLRTPLLPFDTLIDWARDVRAPAACAASDDALEEALRADRALLRERLAQFVLQPQVKEAIALASGAMAELLRDPTQERLQRAEGTFVRYLLRMSARPTPFGLMAGISAGGVGRETRLELAPRAHYRRKTQLDGATIAALGEALIRDPAIRAEAELRPNADIYERAGELRYFVAAASDAHSFRLTAVERSPWVDAAIRRAKTGARPGQVASAIAPRARDRARAAAFVDAMIDARVLVSELEAPVTGEEPLAGMTRALRRGGAASRAAAESLELVRDALRRADSTGLVPPADVYAPAHDALRRLVSPGRRPPFLVDLVKPVPGLCVDSRIVAQVLATVRVLHRISPRSRDAALERFGADFERRYGAQPIRLVDALDPEHGIGFAPASTDVPWGPADGARLELLRRASAKREKEVVLSSDDLQTLCGDAHDRTEPLPDAFAALVTLAAGSDAALRRGDFRVVVHSVHGPSGARLLGRACRVDPAVHAGVVAHLRDEERLRPLASFVEIVMLPKQHHRNVMGRPVLRDYELTFACRSGASPEQQIPIADLVLAVEGERIVLRSASLGRELLPRLSCAINWAHPEGHPVLRLLGALQQQNSADPLRFDWGPLAAARFLPRVCHGRAVLSVARWRVRAAPLKQALATSAVASFRRVQEVRAELGLPRFVHVEDGDTPLAVDLDNPLCVDALLRMARSADELRLSEIFPGPEAMCVRGPEGRYAHELIIPFVATTQPQNASRPRSTSTPVAVSARAKIPGTDWLYAKVYCGVTTSDALLCDVLAPALRRAVQSGAVDRWFFVRYWDPEPHLRVRAHGPPRRLAAELLPAIANAMRRPLADARVWRMQIDTYEREVERFGGLAALDVAERVFWLDSEAVVAILEQRPTLGERRHWAIVGVDRLLRAVGLAPGERMTLVGAARDGLAQELDHELSRRERSAHFRAERATIAQLLGAEHAGAARVSRSSLLRDEGLARAARRLRALDRAATLETALTDIVASYVHMHNNRLFAADQRRSELLVLDMLYRHYASLVQR